MYWTLGFYALCTELVRGILQSEQCVVVQDLGFLRVTPNRNRYMYYLI